MQVGFTGYCKTTVSVLIPLLFLPSDANESFTVSYRRTAHQLSNW